MNTSTDTLRAALPAPVRHFLRARHRDWVLRRAMAAYRRNPLAAIDPDSPLLADLVYGWGNDGWSALREYLAACIRHALVARGPILECGSGLTTLLVGVAAEKAGVELWSMEHLPDWGDRVGDALRRFDLGAVRLHVASLRDYAGYAWYDPPLKAMPYNFSLVICDGPPGSTWGGRYGLLPIMGKKLAPDCVILLDDGARTDEQSIARRWQAESGGSLETLGEEKPYIRLFLRNPA
ncbi:MAG TPA: hypothetical protein VFF03_12535 [Rhodocyclaceae bacterium]|nr:hypothetical protein [Rhodocyclaceae bacterium]